MKMKKIVAINGSPRASWNTAQLVQEAAKGAEAAGAEIQYFDLYKLEKYNGCVSCFGCKREATYGKCVCPDGLAPVLESIRNADGLILGSPIYLGNFTAGFRALYERLIFQSLTYCREKMNCNDRKIPVLLIATSNCSEDRYETTGYTKLLNTYLRELGSFVGPASLLICSDTLQVSDYSKYNWTMFDPEAKKQRHEEVFPADLSKACAMGAALVE